MMLEIKENEINALKWLLLKGMEQTNSDRKFEIFERLSDALHQRQESGQVDAPCYTAKQLKELLEDQRKLCANTHAYYAGLGIAGEELHEKIRTAQEPEFDQAV